jgi:hypothetical protein
MDIFLAPSWTENDESQKHYHVLRTIDGKFCLKLLYHLMGLSIGLV